MTLMDDGEVKLPVKKATDVERLRSLYVISHLATHFVLPSQ